MIREVLIDGDKRLLQISQEVTKGEFSSMGLLKLIRDMQDTMEFKHGIGISAVQVGVLKRIALIGYDQANPRYKEIGHCPLTVIINPTIEPVGSETCEYNEGCLSVPDIRGIVSRPKQIRYRFYNEHGELISGESADFFARVLQHEIDHMDGILFPMRINQEKL